MGALVPLLLCLLSALVEVHSQTAPYLTFMGSNIPNHSFVDLNTIGNINDGSNSLQCHTDLTTCCNRVQGPDRGDWYIPNGNRLGFPGRAVTFQVRTAQRVDLRYVGGGGLSGIYRCDIETTAVNDRDGRKVLYVGLYSTGGE